MRIGFLFTMPTAAFQYEPSPIGGSKVHPCSLLILFEYRPREYKWTSREAQLRFVTVYVFVLHGTGTSNAYTFISHHFVAWLKLRSDAQGIQEPNMSNVWKLHGKSAALLTQLLSSSHTSPPPPPSCNPQRHRWQMEKIFNQKNFNNFVWSPLGSRGNIYINFCLQVNF
jgi:hypothetical protein